MSDKPPMRLLVCGGRDYEDREAVFAALDHVHQRRGIACLIHGAARGADRLGAEWAAARGVPTEPYPADWATYGKAAGPVRNRRMLEQGRPDGVAAFPGGNGTADMVRIAEAAGLTVWKPRA